MELNTNKPGMVLRSELRKKEYKKEFFEILYHFYVNEETGIEVFDEQLNTINNLLLSNKYRETYNLPFPDEIKSIRDKYELPANKMAEILGFGINIYRNYENGEMPSSSNARLIQLAKNPKEFKSIVKLSGVYSGSELDKLIGKIEKIEKDENSIFSFDLIDFLMGTKSPNEYNGYRVPRLQKFLEMIVFFTEQLSPWKTKMNKLLFYADFLHFKRTCYGISGCEYRAIQLGPVPKNFSSLFEHAGMCNDVNIMYTEFSNGGIGEQFVPYEGRKFKSELFSDTEIQAMKDVVKGLGNLKTNALVNLSHDEPAWLENVGKHQEISYSYSFDLKNIK